MSSKSYDFEEEVAVLHLTDIHGGEVINLPENKYNLGIMSRRMEYLFDKFVRIGRDIYGRVMSVREVVILITGDMIHNETMRGSAKMAAEVNFTEAKEVVSESLASQIVKMAHRWGSIKSVRIHGAIGNHGRVGKPGEEDVNANFDREVYNLIKLKVKLKVAQMASLKARRVQFHFNFPKGNMFTARIAGWYFVGEHWNDVKNQLGIPYYGLSRKRDRRYKQLQGKMHYYLGGHYHRGYYEEDGAVETLMGGSMCGVNGFASGAALAGKASQWMYMVSRRHGITVMRPLKLQHIQSEEVEDGSPGSNTRTAEGAISPDLA